MEEIEKKLKYLKHWEDTCCIFIERYLKFKKLDRISERMDWETYFDILLVHLRAFCFENERYEKNLTLQNALKELNKWEEIKKLKEYLDRPVLEEEGESVYRVILTKNGDYQDLTIRVAVKYITDKLICHNDYVYDDYLYMIILNQLKYYNGQKLKEIIEDILAICRGEDIPSNSYERHLKQYKEELGIKDIDI